MILQYNYRLATGTVGQVLYRVNQMEKYANFTSTDRKALDEALGNVFSLIVDAKVHLNRLLKNLDGTTDAGMSSAVSATLDAAVTDIREIRGSIDDTGLARFALFFQK